MLYASITSDAIALATHSEGRYYVHLLGLDMGKLAVSKVRTMIIGGSITAVLLDEMRGHSFVFVAQWKAGVPSLLLYRAFEDLSDAPVEIVLSKLR